MTAQYLQLQTVRLRKLQQPTALSTTSATAPTENLIHTQTPERVEPLGSRKMVTPGRNTPKTASRLKVANRDRSNSNSQSTKTEASSKNTKTTMKIATTSCAPTVAKPWSMVKATRSPKQKLLKRVEAFELSMPNTSVIKKEKLSVVPSKDLMAR